MRKLILSIVACGVAFRSPLPAQTAKADGARDLATGIRQVEVGDLEAAILTLDTAARLLKQESGREKDVATAHFYLAVAQLGLGQWERAKVEMRDAWRNNRKLALDPEKEFSPQVIQLYAQTKQEMAQPMPPAAGSGAAQADEKRGGSSLPTLLAVGAAAGVGAGVAVVLSQKDETPVAAPTPSPTPIPAPTPTPPPTVSYQQIASTDVPKPIPEVGQVSSNLQFNGTGTIVVITVWIDIRHTRSGDLTLDLIHPDGTAARIFTGDPQSGQADIRQEFDLVSAPTLQIFVGKPSFGIWRLDVTDRTAPDSGVLNAWSISIGGYF